MSVLKELKEKRVWFCWHFEIRKGKRTKVPISARGQPTGVSADYEYSWTTYEEAKAAAEANHYDGVGFVIPEGYFFLDIDHKALDNPLVQTQLARFNSYTEYSQSGEGIHIYGMCDLSKIPTCVENGRVKVAKEFYTKNPHNQMELYIGGLTNRYAAFTGNIIVDEDFKDCTQAVITTLEHDMRRAEKKKYSEKRDGDKADFNIIEQLKRQKNGEKFIKLYEKGDISDYGSASEADCALCALLAFRTGNNPDRIFELIKKSALYREKWEREDYRTATIERGIEACHGTFHKSVMPKPYFIKYNDFTGEFYVDAPLLAKYTRENLHYLLVRDNGKQGLLKYVYEDGVYRLYADDMFKGIIKQYIADYDEELVKMSKVNEAYQIIVTDLNYISQDRLNADEGIINFENCLLKVTATDLIVMPHSPDVLSTIRIPCKWTGEPSPTPVFKQYIETLMNGDKALIRLLLEIYGVVISCIKCWRMKKSLFLEGLGDTGKSVYKSFLELLLGRGNYIGIDLKEIEARFGTGAIYGTRLAGSSDMSFLSVDELKTFKKITGGDSLFAEFKGMQAFEYVYDGFLMFCMNRLPKFGGDDGQWVYDRIMVVHCPNVIPKAEQDKQLIDKLYDEREGITYMSVRALQQVIANGYRFSEPESVSLARKAYQSENSTIVGFFTECMCSTDDEKFNYHCTTGRIYKVYQAWCRENNNGYAKTAKEFREILSELIGGTFAEVTTRRNGNTYYRDYTLNAEAKDQYAKEYGYDTTDFL